MSRLLLLLIFALWLLGSPAKSPPVWNASLALGLFFGGYTVLVLGAGLWAQRLSNRVGEIDLHAAANRFNRMLTIARVLIPVWLAFGLFGPVGWSGWVMRAVGPIALLNIPHPPEDGPVQLALPGLLLGTLPAVLAWMGLWWAQFPADRALREQSLLDQLDCDLPVHAPPRLRQFFAANFRQQILFMLLPVILILLVRDLVLLAIRAGGWSIGPAQDFENWVMLPAAGLVFIFAPELLRRVLDTRPLPDSPLRRRLEAICQRVGLRYRDILLWHTQYSMGNAAVMGLVPRLRYILLSDLLLESLTDQQIEAVFAHEAGHIVHRHMAWYVVFFGILTLGAVGPGFYFEQWLLSHLGSYAPLQQGAEPIAAGSQGFWEMTAWTSGVDAIREALGAGIALGTTVLVFGFLSRRFERQADVFAARMMQSNWGLGHDPATQNSIEPGTRRASHVGEYGAAIFTSALRRVAAVNNMPIAARSWCHGSIAKRIGYLDDLSTDPALTSNFDRFMSRLYATLILVLLLCGAVVLVAK